MSKYGIRSAILTMLYLRRDHLETKEEVKQHNLGVRKAQLKKEKGETSVDFTTRNHYSEKLSIKLLLSDDLESFYTNYLFTFGSYKFDSFDTFIDRFVEDIKKFKESSDLESIFSNSYGGRLTTTLHLTL